MATVSIPVRSRQASALEIYVVDPVHDDDLDRPPVTFDGKRMYWDSNDTAEVWRRMMLIVNALDDEAEDKSGDAESRAFAREYRDSLTALMRRIR
jgi:hypothetical protein